MVITNSTPFYNNSPPIHISQVIGQQHIDSLDGPALADRAFYTQYIDRLEQQGLKDPVVTRLGKVFRGYQALLQKEENFSISVKLELDIWLQARKIRAVFMICVFSLLLQVSARLFFPRYPLYISALNQHAAFTIALWMALITFVFQRFVMEVDIKKYKQKAGRDYAETLRCLEIEKKKIKEDWTMAQYTHPHLNLVFAGQDSFILLSHSSFAGRISKKNCV